MLLTEAVLKLLNEQISHEFNNQTIYRNVQAYFSNLNLNGWAAYFGQQAEGEYDHYKHIIAYLDDKNAPYEINVLPYENYKFGDVKEILKKYYDTEILTTTKLYAIAEQSKVDNDHGTVDWLYTSLVSEGGLSLIAEQIEEERSALDLQAEVLDGLGDNEQLNMQWIREIDKRLFERVNG
ncbi:MAG: ferritin-like domain-containing protein [Bacillota bacterium]|nr:ferritin-like domain-containing protein [Bacillota bacterium]